VKIPHGHVNETADPVDRGHALVLDLAWRPDGVNAEVVIVPAASAPACVDQRSSRLPGSLARQRAPRRIAVYVNVLRVLSLRGSCRASRH